MGHLRHSHGKGHLGGAIQRGLSLKSEGGESGGLESTDNTIKLVYNHVDTARDCYLRTKDNITSVSKRPGKLEVPRPCGRRLALIMREHTSLTEVSGSFLRSKTAWSLCWTASGRVVGPRTQLWWTSGRVKLVSSAEPTVFNSNSSSTLSSGPVSVSSLCVFHPIPSRRNNELWIKVPRLCRLARYDVVGVQLTLRLRDTHLVHRP
jgi:hypothetical protein